VNQRIRELERQAMIGVLNGNDPDGDVDRMYIPAEFTKKFAELIIRKCLEIMDDEDDYAIECSARMAAYRVKKHFGVEE
jgi:hypothetical protein